MASARKLLSTQEVIDFFESDVLSIDCDSSTEETFDEYIGTMLPDEDDRGHSEDDIQESSTRSTPLQLHDDLQGVPEDILTSKDSEESQEAHISVPSPQNSITDTIDPWGSSDDECGADDLEADESSTVSYMSDSTEDTRSESDSASETSNLATSTVRGRGNRGIRGGSRGLRRGSRGARQGNSGNVRGSGRGMRRGHSRGSRGHTGRGLSVSFQSLIPPSAKSISIPDACFQEPEEFMPIRTPGPHIPYSDDSDVSGLDLFRLFIDDETLDRLVTSTLAYVESKKDHKRSMYQRFMKQTLDRDEMARYIGVLLLLSINSTRNYQQAWNPKSSQVSLEYLNNAIPLYYHILTIHCQAVIFVQLHVCVLYSIVA